jgi:hypothetical protein
MVHKKKLVIFFTKLLTTLVFINLVISVTWSESDLDKIKRIYGDKSPRINILKYLIGDNTNPAVSVDTAPICKNLDHDNNDQSVNSVKLVNNQIWGRSGDPNVTRALKNKSGHKYRSTSRFHFVVKKLDDGKWYLFDVSKNGISFFSPSPKEKEKEKEKTLINKIRLGSFVQIESGSTFLFAGEKFQCSFEESHDQSHVTKVGAPLHSYLEMFNHHIQSIDLIAHPLINCQVDSSPGNLESILSPCGLGLGLGLVDLASYFVDYSQSVFDTDEKLLKALSQIAKVAPTSQLSSSSSSSGERIKYMSELFKKLSDFQFPPELMIRELTSNGLDAYDSETLAAERKVLWRSSGEGEIAVEDFGKGMNLKDLIYNLLLPGRSGKTKELFKDQKDNQIGQFGQGFLSILSYLENENDQIIVHTKTPNGKSWQLNLSKNNVGKLVTTLKEGTRETAGTSVVVKSGKISKVLPQPKDVLSRFFKANPNGVISFSSSGSEAEVINHMDTLNFTTKTFSVENTERKVRYKTELQDNVPIGEGSINLVVSGVIIEKIPNQGNFIHQDVFIDLPADLKLTEDRLTLDFTSQRLRSYVEKIVNDIIKNKNYSLLNSLTSLIEKVGLMEKVKINLSLVDDLFLPDDLKLKNLKQVLDQNDQTKNIHLVNPKLIRNLSKFKVINPGGPLTVIPFKSSDQQTLMIKSNFNNQGLIFVDEASVKDNQLALILAGHFNDPMNFINPMIQFGNSISDHRLIKIDIENLEPHYQKLLNEINEDSFKFCGQKNASLLTELWKDYFLYNKSKLDPQMFFFNSKVGFESFIKKYFQIKFKIKCPPSDQEEKDLFSKIGPEQKNELEYLIKANFKYDIYRPYRVSPDQEFVFRMFEKYVFENGEGKNPLKLLDFLKLIDDIDSDHLLVLETLDSWNEMGSNQTFSKLVDKCRDAERPCRSSLYKIYASLKDRPDQNKILAELNSKSNEDFLRFISIFETNSPPMGNTHLLFSTEIINYVLGYMKDWESYFYFKENILASMGFIKIPQLIVKKWPPSKEIFAEVIANISERTINTLTKAEQDNLGHVKFWLKEVSSGLDNFFSQIINSLPPEERLSKMNAIEYPEFVMSQAGKITSQNTEKYNEALKHIMSNSSDVLQQRQADIESLFEYLFQGEKQIPVHKKSSPDPDYSEYVGPLESDPRLKKVMGEDFSHHRKLIAQAVNQRPEPFTWVRELIKNSREAGAKNIKFEIKKSTDGKLVLEVHDDGKGLSKKNIHYFYIPKFSGKNPGDKQDINFGWGAYSLFDYFQKVGLSSKTDDLNDPGIQMEMDYSPTKGMNLRVGGNPHLKAPVQGTHLSLQSDKEADSVNTNLLKYFIKKLSKEIKGIEVTLDEVITNDEPEIVDPLAVESKMVIAGKDVELKIQKGSGGIYYNGELMNSDLKKYEESVPEFLKEFMPKNLSVKITGDLAQTAGRGQFIHQKEIDEKIKKSLGLYLMSEMSQQRINSDNQDKIIPYDFFYDFRGPSLDLIPGSREEKLVKAMKSQNPEEINLDDFNEFFKNPKEIGGFLIHMPLIENSPKTDTATNLIQIREEIISVLKKDNLLNQAGEINSDSSGLYKIYAELRSKYQEKKLSAIYYQFEKSITQDFWNKETQKMMAKKHFGENLEKTAPIEFSDFDIRNVPDDVEREVFSKKEHQSTKIAAQMGQEFFDEILSSYYFNKESDLSMKLKKEKPQIGFYLKADNSQAHFAAFNNVISFNLVGKTDAFGRLKKHLEEPLGDQDFLELMNTFVHELAHQQLGHSGHSHDEMFFEKMRELMLPLIKHGKDIKELFIKMRDKHLKFNLSSIKKCNIILGYSTWNFSPGLNKKIVEYN